jgi:hypothetical protein
MADRMPDYQAEQQKLIALVKDFEMRIEKYKLDILSADDRKRTAVKNWIATEEQIGETKKTLAAIEKEHGKPKIDWDAIRASVLETIDTQEEE